MVKEGVEDGDEMEYGDFMVPPLFIEWFATEEIDEDDEDQECTALHQAWTLSTVFNDKLSGLEENKRNNLIEMIKDFEKMEIDYQLGHCKKAMQLEVKRQKIYDAREKILTSESFKGFFAERLYNTLKDNMIAEVELKLFKENIKLFRIEDYLDEFGSYRITFELKENKDLYSTNTLIKNVTIDSERRKTIKGTEFKFVDKEMEKLLEEEMKESEKAESNDDFDSKMSILSWFGKNQENIEENLDADPNMFKQEMDDIEIEDLLRGCWDNLLEPEDEFGSDFESSDEENDSSSLDDEKLEN